MLDLRHSTVIPYSNSLAVVHMDEIRRKVNLYGWTRQVRRSATHHRKYYSDYCDVLSAACPHKLTRLDVNLRSMLTFTQKLDNNNPSPMTKKGRQLHRKTLPHPVDQEHLNADRVICALCGSRLLNVNSNLKVHVLGVHLDIHNYVFQ